MKKTALFLVALMTFSGCSTAKIKNRDTDLSKGSDAEVMEEIKLNGEEVAYYGEMPEIKGYLATPEGDGEYPALILIHEWWGLNDNIRQLADDFAKEGYVALAVDLYDGQSTKDPAIARELATNVRGEMDGAFANLAAARGFLDRHEKVAKERIGAIGWCFGGGWAYQLAKNDLGVNASVIYYGRFNPEDDLQQMRADIIGHFGEEDASIKVDDVREFQATLKTLSGNHEIYIYPNAGHAFANDDSASYVPEAAEQAWTRTVDFLSRNL